MTKCHLPECDSDAHHLHDSFDERLPICPPCLRKKLAGRDPLDLNVEAIVDEPVRMGEPAEDPETAARAEFDRTYRPRERFEQGGKLYRCYTHNPDDDKPGQRPPGVTYVVADSYDEAAAASEALEGRDNWPLRIDEIAWCGICLSTPAFRAHELEQDRLDREHAIALEAEYAPQNEPRLDIAVEAVMKGWDPCHECGSAVSVLHREGCSKAGSAMEAPDS